MNICIGYFGKEFEKEANTLATQLKNKGEIVNCIDLKNQKGKSIKPEQLIILEHSENAILNNSILIGGYNPSELKNKLEKTLDTSITKDYVLISCQAGLSIDKNEPFAQKFADLFTNQKNKHSVTIRAATIPTGAKDGIVTASTYEHTNSAGEKNQDDSVEYSFSMKVDDGIPALSQLTQEEINTVNSVTNAQPEHTPDTLFTLDAAKSLKTTINKNYPALGKKIQTSVVFSTGTDRLFSEGPNTYYPGRDKPTIYLPVAVTLNVIERRLKELTLKGHNNKGLVVEDNTQSNKLISLRRKLNSQLIKITSIDLLEEALLQNDCGIIDKGLADQIRRSCGESIFSNRPDLISREPPIHGEVKIVSPVSSTNPVAESKPTWIQALFIWLFGLTGIRDKFSIFQTLAEENNFQDEINNNQSILHSAEEELTKAIKTTIIPPFVQNPFSTTERQKIRNILNGPNCNLTLEDKVELILKAKFEKLDDLKQTYAKYLYAKKKMKESLTRIFEPVKDLQQAIQQLINTYPESNDDAGRSAKREALTLLKQYIENPNENNWTTLENFTKHNKEIIEQATFFSKTGYVINQASQFKAALDQLKPKQNDLSPLNKAGKSN